MFWRHLVISLGLHLFALPTLGEEAIAQNISVKHSNDSVFPSMVAEPTLSFQDIPSQFTALARSVSANNSIASQKPPSPPPRIPPNKVKPGGGLDFAKQACSDNDQSLIALVPVDNPVLTVSAYPSFLFYIPDSASEIGFAEFSLLAADEKSRVYTVRFVLPESPGIVKIDLPQSPQFALEEDKFYHWYLQIHCQGDRHLDSQNTLNVNGWIKRVALTAKRQAAIENASPAIWYDAIAETAKGLLLMPNNQTLQEQWLALLEYIDREDLAPASLFDLETSIDATTLKPTAN